MTHYNCQLLNDIKSEISHVREFWIPILTHIRIWYVNVFHI